MADRENHNVCGDHPRTGCDSSNSSGINVEILDPTRKSNLTAEFLKLSPQGSDDERESVRSEMWPMLVNDGRFTVALSEDLEDPKDIRSGVSRRKFPVTKRPRPPFTEKIVTLGIQGTAGVEAPDIRNPILDRFPPLKDERGITVTGKQVAGNQTCRARSNNDWALR
jgi:hypothetical protein